MADNTTTYKAVVDVETKGLDNLDKLNKNLDESIEGFVDLEESISKTRKALQKAKISGDKTEFKRLRKELNGLERTFEDTEIQSRRFSDALAQQPGIVGLVGGSLKGLDGGLKVLAANPIIAVVTLLAGLFIALKESLGKTERGQELLNKASEAFGKILGPVFAIIEKVAFPIFEFFIEVLDKVAAGFNKFAKFLGIGTKEIEEASRASSEVLQKKYDEATAAEEEATKKLEEESKKRIELAKKENEERTKKLEADSLKRIELEKKEAEERAAARKALLEEAANILAESELSIMDKRTRELTERESRYQAELKVLKEAGITDLKAFEEEYRIDLLAINTTYNDQEQAALDAKLAREKELKDQALAEEKQRLLDLKTYEEQLRLEKIETLQTDWEFKQSQNAQSFESEVQLFDDIRALERQNLVAKEVSAQALINFDKQTATVRTQIEEAQAETKLAIISNALGAVADMVGRETVAGKALAISQALINTYLGATKALATYPPPWGAIAAGTVIAGGLLQVNAIRKQKLPSIPKPGGGSTSGGGGGGASFAPPPKPSTSFSAPELSAGGAGQGNTNVIAETIASSQNRPLRAYVVSSDISSQQAMDRRTSGAATL